YVMYAKVGAGEEETGVGKGLVDIFTTGGAFVKRFATGGLLNAPWGVALAPATFDNDNDQDKQLLLVGNFGDGRINAYRAADGKFVGQLTRKDKSVIEIEGLWALSFPPSTSTIDPNRLYFTAGPDDEEDGLFGYLIRDKSNGDTY
ncbi:MAG TPA: TIGR03118 family protein, partial [Niastella sp.]|nr:TIGR03118 family protein [Niastella sp.]